MLLIQCLMITQLMASVINPLDIMEKNKMQRLSKDEEVTVTIHLIDQNQKERIREIVKTSKTNELEEQKSLIRFIKPEDAKGIGLLVHEHSLKDTDRWIYLPALKKSRRIASNKKSDTFMGSDFTYEDLENERIQNNSYQYLGDTLIEGMLCYKIESKPKTDEEIKNSGYSKRNLYVNHKNNMILRVEYFDKKGEYFKKQTLSDIIYMEKYGKWRTHKMEMENIKTGHKTVLIFKNFKINEGIIDDLFTIRYLEREL